MNKMVDYIIVGNETARKLCQAVTEKIESGWQPYYGPYVGVWEDGSSEVFHFQAMVKYETT